MEKVHHPSPDGLLVIPAPLGWWKQIQRERICRRLHGHCYHHHLFTFWNCCMCGGTTDGLPRFGCRYCLRRNP